MGFKIWGLGLSSFGLFHGPPPKINSYHTMEHASSPYSFGAGDRVNAAKRGGTGESGGGGGGGDPAQLRFTTLHWKFMVHPVKVFWSARPKKTGRKFRLLGFPTCQSWPR